MVQVSCCLLTRWLCSSHSQYICTSGSEHLTLPRLAPGCTSQRLPTAMSAASCAEGRVQRRELYHIYIGY